MSQAALQAVGGLGLFLVGMSVMTDGLRRLAGRGLRSVLRRFTRSPASGAAVGAATTAIVQSSSATTVAAVGMVGAGAMTFAQSLGIIFGANVGTTVTGWLVLLFGFKIELGTLAYPIVFAGALGITFGKGRWAAVGYALAGFGLLFIGIDFLQSGLAGLEGRLTPGSFPPDTWLGRLQLVGLGVLITLVTQSSSAGVAMAIAAVYAGTITFPQAAAIVIGMDVGTTVTAAMAVIGGGTEVKRTGLAHVIYNVLTGTAAFFLLVPYVSVVERIAPDVLTDQPELLLVAFHTVFNGAGVLAVLPFADRFAHLVERLVPTPADDPTHRLGRALLTDADAALDVVDETLRDITGRLLAGFRAMWDAGRATAHDLESVAQLRTASRRAQEYILAIEHDDEHELRLRQQAALHACDHVDRLADRFLDDERLMVAVDDPELRRSAAQLLGLVDDERAWLDGEHEDPVTEARLVTQRLVDGMRPYRRRSIARSIEQPVDADAITMQLDAYRWIARIAAHLWRVNVHLDELSGRPVGN